MENNDNNINEEKEIDKKVEDSSCKDEIINDDIESIKMENLIEENSSLKNSLAIIQADFINFKNRIEKERKQSVLLANEALISKLLPIIDDLERALEHSEKCDEFTTGIKIILDNFKEILSKEGLEEIESNNTQFDHNFHQAILMEKTDSFESGYIIETFLKGYKLNNKILRPSMVKVSE